MLLNHPCVMDHHKCTSIAGSLANDRGSNEGSILQNKSGAKTTAIQTPCQNKPPCESKPLAAKRRAVPEDTGMGKRQPHSKISRRLTSFQKKKAALKRKMRTSGILLLGEGEKLPVSPAVPKVLGHRSQPKVCTMGP